MTLNNKYNINYLFLYYYIISFKNFYYKKYINRILLKNLIYILYTKNYNNLYFNIHYFNIPTQHFKPIYYNIIDIFKTSKVQFKGKILHYKIITLISNRQGWGCLGIAKSTTFSKALEKSYINAWKNQLFLKLHIFNKNKQLVYKDRKVELKINIIENKVFRKSSLYKIINILGINNIVIYIKPKVNKLSKIKLFWKYLKIFNKNL